MSSSSAKLIFNALTKHASSGSSYMYRYVPEALTCPAEGVALNYKDLLENVTNVSKGLILEGFGPNTKIAASFPNSSSNVILQLACSITGTTYVSCKDPADLSDISKQFECHGTTTEDFEWLLKKSSISIDIEDIFTAKENSKYAYYNASVKETALKSLVSLAKTTSKHFRMTEKDITIVPVSLNHTMGMGFGVLPSLLSGGSVVLPSPSPSPELVVKALLELQATLLIADTHLVAKVNELGAGQSFEKFRGGLVKIGSGEDIDSNETRDILGVTVDTVGVPKK
jgi:acyl-CoA synthetase (AMP-forming)/AMP-acid ligase II